MRISELFTEELPAVVLGEETWQQARQLLTGGMPTQYIWDLYGGELGIESLYARLHTFLFTCALKAPAHPEDDAFFNTFRHDAFVLAHTSLPPLANGVSARYVALPTFLSLIGDLMSQRSSYQRFTTRQDMWSRPSAPDGLREMTQAEINGMPRDTAPNLYSTGEWFDLLGYMVYLCEVVQMSDRNPDYDYELEPEQVTTLTELIAWFGRALAYQPHTS